MERGVIMWKKILYAVLILIILAFFIIILASIGKKDKKHKKMLRISIAGVFSMSIIMQLVDPFIFGTQ